METPRKRGGQHGNRNALRHGYYSKIFSKEEKKDYCSAGGVEGLDEEIALMRHVIKTTASCKDDKHLLLMVRASNALNKLVRTRQKINSGRYNNLQSAIKGVMEDILIPMGVNFGSSILAHQKVSENGTNKPQNEANLP
jgi:hypothetical protein